MQISSKVALSIVLVVAAVGAATTAVALDRQETELRREFVQTNSEALQLLSLAIAPAVAEGRHDRVQAILDNVANFHERFPDVEQLEVIDRNQRVTAALDPTRFNEVVGDANHDLQRERAEARWDETSGVLRITVPLKLKHNLGVMRAELSDERLTSSIDDQRQGAIGLLAITMVVMGLALHLIHRRLVAGRLAELAKAAGALGDGKMDVRAAVTGKDEIAELGSSFNQMADAIKLYTEDLEHIIEERTEDLRAANKRLEQLATTDQLTGVWNRRYFEEAARRALEVARRNERPICVALVDTDKFKSVNDTFGHPVGDRVLQAVAKVLRDNARKADLVARIGGEEFAILMPESGIGLAAQAVERMRAALEEEVGPRVPELGDRVITASFGVAAFEKAGDTLDDLLSAADEAMYASKTSGRNRVTIADRGDTAAPPPVEEMAT